MGKTRLYTEQIEAAKAEGFERIRVSIIMFKINDAEHNNTDLVVDVMFKSLQTILAQIGGIMKILTLIFVSVFSSIIWKRFIHTLATALRKKLSQQTFNLPSRTLS